MAAYWEIAAHSVYDMFSKFKYLIVYLFLPASVLNFFLTAHFPDHCLLVPFYVSAFRNQNNGDLFYKFVTRRAKRYELGGRRRNEK